MTPEGRVDPNVERWFLTSAANWETLFNNLRDLESAVIRGRNVRKRLNMLWRRANYYYYHWCNLRMDQKSGGKILHDSNHHEFVIVWTNINAMLPKKRVRRIRKHK